MKKIANVKTSRHENMGATLVRFVFENGWALSCRLERLTTEVAVFNPRGLWRSKTVFTEVLGKNYDYADYFDDSECVVEYATPDEVERLANYIADIEEN